MSKKQKIGVAILLLAASAPAFAGLHDWLGQVCYMDYALCDFLNGLFGT